MRGSVFKESLIFCFSLLFALSLESNAAEVLIINDANKDFFLSDKHLSIIEDKGYKIADVASEKFKSIFDASRIKGNEDNQEQAYWYRFSIKNSLRNNEQLIYELLNFQLDKINLYIPDEQGNYIEQRSGDFYPFPFREFNHKNFLFILPKIDSSRVLTCYLRIEVNHRIVYRARSVVRSEQRLLSYALKEYYALGIFYGILFIMLIYNIILFFNIRSGSYIYYILYILSVALYSLSWNGLGFQYLWPEFPVFNQYALPAASYFLVTWACLYAKSFLLTSDRSKTLNTLFIVVIILRSIIFIWGLTVSRTFLYIYLIDIIALFIGFLGGIVSLADNFKPARYYVVAYSFLSLGFLILTLLHQGIIPPSILSVYSLEIGVVMELIFFSAALADRLKMLKLSEEKALKLVVRQLEENAELKDKVNKELETKVIERTEELQEANQKLKEQAEKITRMNLMLDLDNRKFQENIKDLHSARVFVKDVEIQEFNNLYPDDNSCHKYLSFLKWDEEYKCKKCGNDKFFWGKAPFSRRCTKCGYEESVTAHTIFHNMRIPIQKAFMIVFLVYSSNEKISSTELSKVVSIRQKTCWDYKKLISERILEKKKKLKTDKLGGWDKLILD
jgi:hypothetical protein